eukprot:11850262-Prorocentrum_lima.AAC.1
MSQALPSHITGLDPTTSHLEMVKATRNSAKFAHPGKDVKPRSLCDVSGFAVRSRIGCGSRVFD